MLPTFISARSVGGLFGIVFLFTNTAVCKKGKHSALFVKSCLDKYMKWNGNLQQNITFGINNPYSEATHIDGKCIFYGF